MEPGWRQRRSTLDFHPHLPVSEQLLTWLTILNLLTALFFSMGVLVAMLGVRALLRREDSGEARTQDTDAAVARVLSRRLVLMLNDNMIPEGLTDMAQQLEAYGDPVPTESDVAAAWASAVKVTHLRLGDLAEYEDASLLAHANRIARSMYGMARAAWRNEHSPPALLLGQAYECAAAIVEQTVIAEWPSNDVEIRGVLEYDVDRTRLRGRSSTDPSPLPAAERSQ